MSSLNPAPIRNCGRIGTNTPLQTSDGDSEWWQFEILSQMLNGDSDDDLAKQSSSFLDLD